MNTYERIVLRLSTCDSETRRVLSSYGMFHAHSIGLDHQRNPDLFPTRSVSSCVTFTIASQNITSLVPNPHCEYKFLQTETSLPVKAVRLLDVPTHRSQLLRLDKRRCCDTPRHAPRKPIPVRSSAERSLKH